MKTYSIFLLKTFHEKRVQKKVKLPCRVDHSAFRLFSLMFLVAIFGLITGCDSSSGELEGLSEQTLNKPYSGPGSPEWLASTGTIGTAGSCIGPGGALYVTEGASGKITRIDPKTGEKSTFTEGLPIIAGGVWDVTFYGNTAYALVTLVDDPVFFPTGEVNGIYRIDGPDSHTIIADIGAFNLANPPTGFSYFIKTGVLYSIQNYAGGFLVTDGHLNRVLWITKEGEISIFKAFGNVVPTGLDVLGNTVYMTEAGTSAVNHQNAMAISFSSNSEVTNLASGAPLLVDIEFNRGQTLYALSQGTWGNDGQTMDGDPADANTGSLVRVNQDGTLTPIATGLDRPTSLEFINNTAYIMTLTGDIYTVDNVSGPPLGK